MKNNVYEYNVLRGLFGFLFLITIIPLVILIVPIVIGNMWLSYIVTEYKQWLKQREKE